MHGGLVATTGSCIAIGTRSEHDGKTSIIVFDSAPADIPTDQLVFDGVLEVPSRRLELGSVLGDAYLTVDVPSPTVRVRVWANDGLEPDLICIELQPA